MVSYVYTTQLGTAQRILFSPPLLNFHLPSRTFSPSIPRLIENKYFEGVVLALILLSSFVMTLEDVWFETRPMLMDMLYYLDRDGRAGGRVNSRRRFERVFSSPERCKQVTAIVLLHLQP